ncbi:uncharacterized protein TM35_000016590 [Trypanosoma theileri]|uniref:Uncharacterized protein n=1 Tax=Trypanosoma theileri TaxID=67003 RepID=A0A1X0PA28_9TRYP|nr:uncharacterized protein TM35_000016590 [Trypanosoma theileri]ORC93782.1 hypothetical protein TM35_000016590 [Trypanosoma theileri]
METTDGESPTAARLTREQEEGLVTRLHDHSMKQKQENLQKLDARFYPTAPRRCLPKETIESSVARQVDQEMMKRKAAREEREARIERETIPKKISSEEVESCTERLYTESLARKEANMNESRKRYLFHGPEVTQKKFSEIKEYVARLAVPKKREFTVEEVNKIYGLQ